MIRLESIEHDYIRMLKFQTYKQMSRGKILLVDFLFSHCKVSAANIAIIYCQFHLVCEKSE